MKPRFRLGIFKGLYCIDDIYLNKTIVFNIQSIESTIGKLQDCNRFKGKFYGIYYDVTEEDTDKQRCV